MKSATKFKSAITAAAVATSFAAALADSYQFINPSTWPAANACYSSASAGVALETAGRTGATPSQSLEARYRSWGESDGVPLRSDARSGCLIIFE